MEFQDCLICKKSKATKTNSHIIPSFIVAKVCSYDGSGKRDKEVMFTMTPLEEKLYLGAIPDTKIEELVDTQKLSDERIEQELRNNTASKDYIFDLLVKTGAETPQKQEKRHAIGQNGCR